VRTRKGCVTQFIVISTVQLSSLTLQTSMQVREVNLSYYGAVYLPTIKAATPTVRL
jgi:hypothetical protein